jgi:Cdc6-like AAA superfamily ATPase
LYGPGPLRTLAQLDGSPALALLGEPGSGKSATLKQEHDRVSAQPPKQKTRSIYVDLNATSNEDRLYRRIFESAEMGDWKAGDTRLCLHLDSLDEAMLRIETVPHLLAEGIRELPADRLSVRLACRTAVWPAATLGRTLTSIWGESGRGVFELAPLRRRDVLAALVANDIDPDEFIPKLFGAQAVAFAIKPLTLKMLIALYKRDGRLPTSTGDLYRPGCLAFCEERNDSRRETRRQGQLNGRQRLRIAGRIAVATALSHRFAVWNGPETESPGEDVAASALAGGREDGDFPTFTPSDEDVREVLDTGLFTARGERRMGWAHQTYQEFLAANYLVEKGVVAETISCLRTFLSLPARPSRTWGVLTPHGETVCEPTVQR